MSFESFKQFREQAEECRRYLEFDSAGNYYTLAGYEAFGAGKITITPLEDGEVAAARGFRSLLEATICHRIAGSDERALNRARQGILVCRDVQRHGVKYDAQRALMHEYVGDFRLFAGRDDFDDAYEMASEMYADIENQIGWQADPTFELNISLFLTLAEAVDHDIDREQKGSIVAESLTDRIEYKRKHYQSIISKVIYSRSWTE